MDNKSLREKLAEIIQFDRSDCEDIEWPSRTADQILAAVKDHLVQDWPKDKKKDKNCRCWFDDGDEQTCEDCRLKNWFNSSNDLCRKHVERKLTE